MVLDRERTSPSKSPRSPRYCATPERAHIAYNYSTATPPETGWAKPLLWGAVKLFAWLLLLVVLLVLWILFRFATDSGGYNLHMAQFGLAGVSGDTGMRQFWRSWMDPETAECVGPGSHATTYNSHEAVTRVLKAFTQSLEQADPTVERRNELGFQKLHPFFFSSPNTGPGVMGLGVDAATHAAARPVFGALLDPRTGSWARDNGAMIDRYIEELFAQTEISTESDANSARVMVTRLLFEIHLGRQIDREEAMQFLSFQGSAILAIAVPQYLTVAFGETIGIWLAEVVVGKARDKRAQYFRQFRENLMTHLPDAQFREQPAQQQELITAAVMDSLLFAGGVSVPSVIGLCVALMVDAGDADTIPSGPAEYSGLKDLQLNEANAKAVVWETIRRFPPVGGVSHWRKDDVGQMHRHTAHVWMASQDSTVFDNPDEWKLRGPDAWNNSVMFAEPAIQNNDNLAPHSHVCPAKDLALEISTRFMKHFSRFVWNVPTLDIKIAEMGAKTEIGDFGNLVKITEMTAETVRLRKVHNSTTRKPLSCVEVQACRQCGRCILYSDGQRHTETILTEEDLPTEHAKQMDAWHTKTVEEGVAVAKPKTVQPEMAATEKQDTSGPATTIKAEEL